MSANLIVDLASLCGALAAILFLLVGIRKTVLHVNKVMACILLVFLALHSVVMIFEKLVDSTQLVFLDDLLHLLIVIGWGFFFYGCSEEINKGRLGAEARKMQRALEGMPELVWISDTDKLCIFVNTACLKFTGRRLEQEIGNGWVDCIQEEDRQRCWQTLTAAFDLRQPFEIVYRMRRFDGEYRLISDRGVPFYEANGVFAGYIGSFFDITEQRENEQQLRMQAQLLYGVRESVIATDRDGRVTYWGPGAESLYGYPREEVLGRSVTLIVPPGDESEEAQRMRITLETGFWHGQYQQRRRDGSSFWAETCISLVTNETGEPTGFIGIDRDITSRKQAEETLQRQHELVEAKLQKSMQQLVAKTRFAMLGQISAQIAHEMRNPLGAARNAVYYLRRKIPAQEQKVREYFDLIEQEIDTCNRFITDLREAARPKSPHCELVDLRQAVESAKSYRILPEGVTLRFSAEQEPFEIYVDRMQIVQVLDNLISNSLDALLGKGIIEIVAEQAQDYAIITVQDTGPGIPEGKRDQVFDWLFTSKTKGTGLGLPICRQIVEGHGGKIELCYGGLATGAVFEIRLPRNSAKK